MRVLIVVSQFPELHETFILKEILALAEGGVALRILSLKNCRDRIIHPESWKLLPSTRYAPLSSLRILGEGILECLRHPVRATLCLGDVFSEGKGIFSLLKAFAVYFKSLAFARNVRRWHPTHLHAHWATLPTASAKILSRLLDIPFSFTAHAWDLYVKNPTLRKKVEKSAFVVTCTAYNRDFLISLSPESREKIYLNYHGVALDHFQRREVPHERKPLILSVGRLVETKGFLTLIQALSLLKEKGIPFESVFVGEGPLQRRLEEEVRRLRLENIRLVGSLSRAELLPYYQNASCFVAPSEVAPNGDRDGIPNVLLEAMAMALPVVSTEISGIPEVVFSGRNGLLVSQKDPKALSEAIAKILTDKSLAARYGEEARKTVIEKFDSRGHLHSLIQLFQEKAAKTKIAYGIWSLEVGGAENLVVSLAEGIDWKRFKPVVFCLNQPGALAEKLTSQGIPVFAFRKRPGLDLSLLPRLVFWMRKEKIQIVHTHLWGANAWGRTSAFLSGVPVRIATEHGLQEWRGTLHRLIDKMLVPLTHCILFVAETVREEFCQKIGVKREKCLVIPNGVDTNRFSPPQKHLHKKVALAVGRLSPEKRYDLLLKIWKEPNVFQSGAHLLIVGRGKEKETLLRLKEALHLDGRVQLIEESPAIEEKYREADLFVQSSSREALSLALLEAMATALPVVVSSVGDHPKVIEDGKNGFLVSVGDVKTFSEKILFLLEHPKEAEEIGKAARETVLSRYSKEKMIQDTEKLYEGLLHV